MPVNSQAQADGATDTEMPKRDRTVCMARVQLFIGACAVFPPHVYISESFGLLCFLYLMCLCVSGLRDQLSAWFLFKSQGVHGSGKVRAVCPTTIKDRGPEGALPCPVQSGSSDYHINTTL